MSGFQHPTEDVLFRFIDGEVSGRQARQVRRHLEACWQCRGTVEELQKTIAECIHYRKEIPAFLPAPPRPWADLSREFARVDASLACEPFWKRLGFPAGFAMLRQAFAGVAVLALVAAIIYQFQKTPTVKAAVLLKRAVAAESARAVPVHRVRIRSSKSDVARQAGIHAVNNDAMPADVETLFAEAHYNSQDPLSATTYAEWREIQLESADDPVQTVADPLSPAETCYRIHTVVAKGDVADATLLLSTSDLHAVEGRLDFRDNDFLEFTGLLDSPAGAGNAAARGEHPERSVVPSQPDAVEPGSSASVSDLLEVYSVLHQNRADLGSSVEVSLAGGKVQVGGVGVAPEVQQRLHQELDSRPNVSVQFSEPQALPAGGVDAPPIAAPTPGAVASTWEERLGGHVQFQRFRDSVLKSIDEVSERAYALRTLARTFPVEVESGLRTTDRRVLRDMLRDHLSHLSQQVTEINSLVTPSLTAIGATVQAPGVSEATVWQSSVEDVIRASQLVGVRLSVLLGVNPARNSTPTQLPSDVLTALDNLRVQAEHCTTLVN